jgi:hypothetical protein
MSDNSKNAAARQALSAEELSVEELSAEELSAEELSAEELERYARQIGPGVLPLEGQRKLKQSTVLVTRV